MFTSIVSVKSNEVVGYDGATQAEEGKTKQIFFFFLESSLKMSIFFLLLDFMVSLAVSVHFLPSHDAFLLYETFLETSQIKALGPKPFREK